MNYWQVQVGSKKSCWQAVDFLSVEVGGENRGQQVVHFFDRCWEAEVGSEKNFWQVGVPVVFAVGYSKEEGPAADGALVLHSVAEREGKGLELA